MAVRTFKMPTSLNETLATSRPPDSEIEGSSPKERQNYSESQREPLASHRPKNEPGITYAAQDKLPRLPIPELESTCQKYLNVLKPLQNRREQGDTKIAVQEFLKRDGPELHERLKKYATGKTSYIEQFCMADFVPGTVASKHANLLNRVRFLPQL